MKRLNAKQSIEFSIRVAQLCKTVASMVGSDDIAIIGLELKEVEAAFVELKTRVREWYRGEGE